MKANIKPVNSKYEIMTPDYELSIANVKPTLLKLLGVELPKGFYTFFEKSEFRKHVEDVNLHGTNVQVLLIVDTVGVNQLKTFFPRIAAIHSELGGFHLSSVFPTVTSSALVSIYTGKPPFKHGVLGQKIYFGELGAIVNTLEYTASSGKDLLFKAGVNPKALMWADRLSDLFMDEKVKFVELSHSHILNTGLSRFLYGDVDCYGYQTIIDGFSKLYQIVEKYKDETCIVSFYLGDFDHLGHVHGSHSWEYSMHASYFEKAFILTIKKLRGLPNVAVSFVSDHGGVSLGKIVEFSKSDLDRINEFTGMRVGKSGRVLHFYLKNQKHEDELLSFLESKIGEFGVIVEYEWLKKNRIIRKGEVKDGKIRCRLGDYVLIPSGNVSIRFEHSGRHEMLRPEMGSHGGLTHGELLVPYFIAPVSEVARLLEV